MSTMDGATTTFRLSHHVIIAAAMALVAPATGLAWAVAILTGLVIAADDADRRAGRHVPRSRRAGRVLAVTGGVLGMLVAGAILGGLVAMICLALTLVSERASTGATPTERSIARILLLAGGLVGFVVLGQAIQLDVTVGAAL
jgi:hypothetical protein